MLSIYIFVIIFEKLKRTFLTAVCLRFTIPQCIFRLSAQLSSERLWLVIRIYNSRKDWKLNRISTVLSAIPLTMFVVRWWEKSNSVFVQYLLILRKSVLVPYFAHFYNREFRQPQFCLIILYQKLVFCASLPKLSIIYRKTNIKN